MKGRTISFDLFGTLLLYGDMAAEMAEWTASLYDRLARHGLSCDRETFDGRCDRHFRSTAAPAPHPGLTLFERRLRDLGAGFGLALAPGDLHAMADGLLEIWDRAFTLDADAPAVLDALSRRAALHVVSNFDHPPYVYRVLRQRGLARYFATVTVSGEVGVQKPDPRIFCPVIAGAGTDPGGIVHVGDSDDDVEGARAAGLFPVLLQRPAVRPQDTDVLTLPRVSAGRDVTVIAGLAELPPLLEER